MNTKPAAARSLVVTMGPPQEKPWWWDDLKPDRALCELDFERFSFSDKYSKDVSTLELPWLAVRVLLKLLRWRRHYEYIYTFECDLLSFLISFWQTTLFMRRPRHVILQFIMREKTVTLSSRLKYLLMRYCFHSLHRAVCSSRSEADYYREAFHWPSERAAFVPFHSNPALLEMTVSDSGFVFSGGRTFRDYTTLFDALDGTGLPAKVVGASPPPRAISGIEIIESMPIEEFESLMAASSVVVISLEDRRISIGQSVILQAMSLGKAVIATRTAGTEDYFVDGENGLLVEPGDADGLRKAIQKLMKDSAFRHRLGTAAREAVTRRLMPHHYSRSVRLAVMRDPEQ